MPSSKGWCRMTNRCASKRIGSRRWKSERLRWLPSTRRRSPTLVVKEYITRLSQALNGPAQSDEGEHSSTTTYGTKAANSGMSLQTGSLMRVREAWEGMRGDIAQALESGDLRQPDALALQRHARNLGCLDGGEALRCIAAIAAQDLALLEESDMFADAYDYGEVRWRIKLGLEAQELRFVETQAVVNEARATRLLCESLLQQPPQPPLAHDLDSGARRLRDAEVELEGVKLALKTLGDYIRKMELVKEAHQRQLAPLQTKVAEIRRFDVEHRDKQKSVAWLAARVARERALLPGEQTKTKLVVRQTLKAFRYPLPEAVRSLRRCLEPVPALPLAPIPFYPTWDASLLGALSVPAYSAPSSLLPRAADMKYSERAEVVKAQHWTQLSGMGEKEGEEALARQSKKRAATLKEVSKVLAAQRKIQEEVWIPALDGCEGNARGALKQVPAVHQYIQHWWEQPGQFSAPFVRVKGKNVEEWLQVIRCQPAASLSPM